ncbi:hypothetical protein ACFVQ4_25000 [Streptomyces laurentii]|uniref:hypothetical protein n=1 Tax=Streptomyces laurentii TaxID=39478 RepID=UPI00369682AD
MAEQITLPVYVRVGGAEARWGTITVKTHDGTVREQDTRRELASFFREAAACLENPAKTSEEAPDAAAHQ